MMFPLIWNNQILSYVPCFWYNLEEMTISILFKKLLFMNVFRTNTKKNHEAYPHASTNKWQVGQTRGPVITGLRSISVTCTKLVLCLWNKNKILLFYGKFLYLKVLKIKLCAKNLSFSCVQISTWVSPVICQLQSLWNFVPQESIAELITWNLNNFFHWRFEMFFSTAF